MQHNAFDARILQYFDLVINVFRMYCQSVTGIEAAEGNEVVKRKVSI